MSEENLKIADIIFAYIKGTITESELGELTEWMDAAEDHRELFQQIITSVSYQNKEAVYRRFDSYYDFDLEYLTPEWVIGSFVMYELLLHAEEIFQY